MAGDASQKSRSAAAVSIMMLGCIAVAVFVVGAESSNGPTELATDCSVDPWAHSCHPVSMMDMINKVGHRARSNAIAQHKLKMQLLAQQKVDLSQKDHSKQSKKEVVDITSTANVDGQMHKLLQKKGRAAVAKQVDNLRQEILADAGKLTSFGKKAGYLPPPPGMSKKNAAKKLAAKKAAEKKMAKAI